MEEKRHSSPSYGVLPEVLGPQSALGLTSMSRALERIFSVRLDCSIFDESAEIKKVKEFCVGLLENPVKHAWNSEVSKLHPKKQLAVAGSLFLARKIIPCIPDPSQVDKHIAMMTSRAPIPPPGFNEFIMTQIDSIFPVGWDRGYHSKVFSYAPSSESSCLEFSRSKGGYARYVQGFGKDSFQDHCLGGGPQMKNYEVKYSIVKTSGKQRGVTVASGVSCLLAPLHRTIYDHISKESWVLRGEARGRKFENFQRKGGEVFVSGDYENATDGLNIDTAELILRRILSRCTRVPEGIAEFAIRSLRAEIHYPGGRSIEQTRGQLMGNFLSFPLLCLQNYLAFRFLVPRTVPVRINGDDIVFRCSRPEYEVWAEGVRGLGLTLSKGKTMVHQSCFSLNSAFFCADRKRIREVPVIRMKDPDGRVPSGGDFMRFCRNWKGLARTIVGGLWLRRNTGKIRATGRSIAELGIPADNSQVHWSGLGRREAWFRSEHAHLAAKEIPIPVLCRRLSPTVAKEWTKLPKSAVHTGRQKKEWSDEFRRTCYDDAWTSHELKTNAEDEWWEIVKSTGMEHLWMSYKRALRCKPRLYRGFVRYDLRLRSLPMKVQGGKYWIPKDQIPPPRFCREPYEVTSGSIAPTFYPPPPEGRCRGGLRLAT